MPPLRTLGEWMADRGLSVAELATAVRLEERVIEAVAGNRYTSSPEQRQRIAAALDVDPAEIAWGHFGPIDHIHGHGPQFGRSP